MLGGMAPGVIDLRGESRPIDARTGRADVGAVISACEAAVAAGCEAFTLNVSGKGGGVWGDAETEALCKGLRAGPPSSCLAASLGQLWLHHTSVSDASCECIARLIDVCPQLEQLHLSDCRITAAGIGLVAAAASAAGYGSHARRKKLYINARHLSDAAASAIARQHAASCLVRLFDASRVGDRVGLLSPGGRSPGGRAGGGLNLLHGRGGGKGSSPQSAGKGGGSPPQGGKGSVGKGGGKGGKGGKGGGSPPYGTKGNSAGHRGGDVQYTAHGSRGSGKGKGRGGR